MEEKKQKLRMTVVNMASEPDPYMTIGSLSSIPGVYWKFGADNLFPQAMATLNRRSTVHRGILNSKTRFIAGKAITCDEKQVDLFEWINRCNARNENLQAVVKRLVGDFLSCGNAYMEIVTNRSRSFLNLYHHDYTKCRLSIDKKKIILHHNWFRFETTKDKSKEVAIYPEWTEDGGYLRSMIHFKDYEPQFENYGIPAWIAGMNVSAIAYKTDKWNISRLDNSFNTSGILMVAGEFASDEDWKEFKDEFKTKFLGEGNTGRVLMLEQKKGALPGESTNYTPITKNDDGDWTQLHSQSTADLIIAHSWFRSLSGIADNTGFDTKRILNEYEIALNTIIIDEQARFLAEIKRILNDLRTWDTNTLAFVNRPPATDKPPYMRIWEARKADGMDYDENDPEQKQYLANISKQAINITTA